MATIKKGRGDLRAESEKRFVNLMETFFRKDLRSCLEITGTGCLRAGNHKKAWRRREALCTEVEEVKGKERRARESRKSTIFSRKSTT